MWKIVFALLVCGTSAFAQEPLRAKTLKVLCRHTIMDRPEEESRCEAFIDGVLQTDRRWYQFVGTTQETKTYIKFTNCISPFSLKISDIRNIFNEWIPRHPEADNHDASGAIWLALREKYPCPKDSNSKKSRK